MQNHRFDMININKTARNATIVLRQYQHRKTLLKRATYDFFKDSSKSTQYVLSNQQFCDQCEHIINYDIANKAYSLILKYTFLEPLPSNIDIMEKIGYEKTTFYKYKKFALVAFAELWPPIPHELIVLKKSE